MKIDKFSRNKDNNNNNKGDVKKTSIWVFLNDGSVNINYTQKRSQQSEKSQFGL